MQGADPLAVIAAITGSIIAVVTLVGNFILSIRTAARVIEVHSMVNSKNDLLVLKITELEQQIRALLTKEAFEDGYASQDRKTT